jgi:hypothetical protein
MPFFETLDGQTIQLCVFTAKNQECTRKDCSYSHEPKDRRPCRLFHSKADYCKDGDTCPLGHNETRKAFNQMKLRKTKDKPRDATGLADGNNRAIGHAAGGTGGGGSNASGGGGARADNQNPYPQNAPPNPHNHPLQNTALHPQPSNTLPPP